MMKKVWMLLIGLSVALGLIGILPEARQLQVYPQNTQRDVMFHRDRSYQDFSFSENPTPILRTYYDYMIGSYNGDPLQVFPDDSTVLQYMLTYHGSRTATGVRRSFYSYIDDGSVINNNEIPELVVASGFPAIMIDPYVQKPMYTYQGNFDTDNSLEVAFLYDSLIGGLAGLFSDPQVIIDNPVTVNNGSITTTDNQFLWPVMVSGPSPIAGYRRVYVLTTNSVGHNGAPGNPLIARADYCLGDLESGTVLNWTQITIPELDSWNINSATYRRPYLTILCDESGKVYLCGYSQTQDSDGNTISSNVEIFTNPDYGIGAWTSATFPTTLSSWNPPEALGSNIGYFQDEAEIPYEDTELFWQLTNTTHFNAVLDSEGYIHIPGLWALTNSDGGYYPALQYVKEFAINPATGEHATRDISPQKHSDDNFNTTMQPWDLVSPFGQVDYWLDENTHSIPGILQAWNFPYYDASANGGSMMNHYNHIKMSINQDEGLIAVVWQNCTGAWLGQSPWTYTPEIHIALSSDNGDSWSEPIILNNIDNPQLAGIKPMWVYPANKITFTGMQGDRKVGKLGLLFLDDYTWGAYAISPPAHPVNDGGQVMFTELEIVFPSSSFTQDPFGEPVGSPNMTINTEVRVDGVPATPDDVLAAFSLINGVEEIRGKARLIEGPNPNTTACQLQLHVENDGETIFFKLWRCSEQQLLLCSNIISGVPGISLGSWPNDLYLINTLNGGQVASPTFSPSPGIYQTAQDVQILCPIQGTSVYYTTDGTEPNQQSILYNSPIHLPLGSNITIKAKAYLGNTGSSTTSGGYTVTGSLPDLTIYPPSGTYFFPINISLSCPISDAQIHYTFDGSIPTEDSPLYTGSLPIAFSITLKARAFKAGWNPGPIATAEYILPVSTDPETPSPAFTGIHSLYPNPFRESVNIRLGIKDTEQDYSLTIYNIRGEVVSHQAGHGIGFLDLVWDGRDNRGRKAAAGIYLLRFRSGETTQTRKLILN